AANAKTAWGAFAQPIHNDNGCEVQFGREPSLDPSRPSPGLLKRWRPPAGRDIRILGRQTFAGTNGTVLDSRDDSVKNIAVSNRSAALVAWQSLLLFG